MWKPSWKERAVQPRGTGFQPAIDQGQDAPATWGDSVPKLICS